MQDSKIDTDVMNSLLDSVGEGEREAVWENGTETCIFSYVKWTTSPGSMHDTGCLGLVHWNRMGMTPKTPGKRTKETNKKKNSRKKNMINIQAEIREKIMEQ